MKKDDLRTEKHAIRKSQPGYGILMEFCRRSKSLYNHANYLVRQKFIKEDVWLRYEKLDKLLKQDKEHPDYRNMPTAQSAQQVLRLLDSSWKSFFAAMKDWKGHPEKYLGRPKIPGYLKKDGRQCLILTNQNCRIKDDVLEFPKVFDGFSIRPKFLSDERFLSFQQARILPRKDSVIVELVYKIRPDARRDYNGRCISMDIGVNNLAAVVSNWGDRPFIMNGRPLKSMNQFMNKERAHCQSVLKKTNGGEMSGRIRKLLSKRGHKINDYLHKASRYIINYCLSHDVTLIVIGKNRNWKQECNLGKRANQNFIQIPFDRFITMLEYKAREHGMTVVTTEESYTSGTSFIDDEEPVRECYDKKRRVHRGLFVSDKGIMINADVNGAYQIMKKVIPIKWDRGCVLHPFIVTAA